MKYSATIKEMAGIYAALSKAEEKMDNRINAENAYNEALHQYTANGFQVADGAAMNDAYDAMKTAEKQLKQAFNKLLDIFEVDRAACAGTDAYYCKLANELYHPLHFFYAMRREALELAKTA